MRGIRESVKRGSKGSDREVRGNEKSGSRKSK